MARCPQYRAIAEHLYRFRGIRADAEQIVVGAGSETLIGFWYSFWAGRGAMAWKIPATPRPSASLQGCGARRRPSRWTARACVDALEEAGVRVVHVTPPTTTHWASSCR